MTETIIAEIQHLFGERGQAPADPVDPETPLIGEGAALSSMELVSLCLRLEDLADEQGFVFDWTSEAAMSKARSIFRTVASLAAEYDRQRAEAPA